MQIYNVYQSGKRLYIDEKEIPDNKIVVNKYDNMQQTLRLISDGTLPPRLYWALRNPKLSNKYFILKLVNNEDLIVGTDISATPGLWDMLLIGTDEDYIIEGADIDQSRLTYVSDHFGRLFVRDNFLEELDFEEQCSPTFKVFYDEIMFRLDNIPDLSDIPDKMSDLENDTNFISGVAFKDDGKGNVKIIGTTFGGETEEGGGGSGGNIEVDDKLDEESTNPVQNQVVTKEVKALEERNAKLEETIEKLQIKTTTSPSPFHHITDSANMKVLDFGMEGKTEQDTTSGKNLFDINGDINQYYPGTIMSTNSNVLNDDGTITVNASTSVSVGCGFKIEGIAGKTLTISFDVVSVGTGTGVSSSICIPTQMNYDIKSNISAGKKLVLTKTFGEDINEAIFTFITQSGTGGIIKNVQIEAGSTATDYEPYTGAQPSPNPDYPQEIINAGTYNEVTGRYEIGCRVVNKNLFNCGNSIPSSLGIVDGNIFKTTDKLNSIFSNLTNAVFEENTQYVVAYSKSISFKDVGIQGIQTHIVYTDGTYDGFYLKERGTFRQTSKANKTIKCIQSNNPFGADVEYENMQIYKLTDGDEYIPPQSQPFTLTSPVPLTKWDYLTKRDGVWGWSIWSLINVFNGSETIYLFGKTEDLKTIYEVLLQGVSRTWSESDEPIYCNSFAYVPGNKIYTQSYTQDYVFSAVYENKLYFASLSNEGVFESVDTFKEYLKTAGVTVVCKATSEQSFHPLPDEEQELLNNLETYYGVTNLYNDQGCPMWLTYVNDHELYFNQKLEQINNALLSLGANV